LGAFVSDGIEQIRDNVNCFILEAPYVNSLVENTILAH
ncbi:MAG: hypothetical protein ACI8UG_001330, partial [Gammaproteobacteria bacterium]